MTREEMKEIIRTVIEKMQDTSSDQTPSPACIFGDDPNPCDVTTEYAVGEEDGGA